MTRLDLSDILLPDTPFFITAFYQFIPITDPEKMKLQLTEKAQELGILGLIVLGTEGFNATTCCQNKDHFEAWKKYFKELFNLESLNNKDSESQLPPFLKLSIKVKPEIVTTGRTDLKLPKEKQNQNFHLSPDEWEEVLRSEKEDVVVIDTRNWYEYQLGTFNGALNPNIEKFTEFPNYFKKQNISPDKKILIFCTGGIRCEKGILELQEEGFNNVYQLEGGILNYLKEKPHQSFTGECFVFDNRVAVDQELKPTTIYKLCPHCGQPAATRLQCVRCDHEYLICESCVKIESKKDTCSKNCAFQWQLNKKKGPHQEAPYSKVIKKLKT